LKVKAFTMLGVFMSDIIWIITGKCSLSCIHCYAAKFRGADELSTQECLRIIGEAAELGVAHIGFSGGEPFLRKDFLGLLKETADHGIYATVVTSGIAMSDSISSRLARLEAHVYLSMDGVREEHEAIRGRGSWKYVEEAARSMIKHGVEFSTVTLLTPDTPKSIGRVFELADSIGASFLSFIPLMPSGRGAKLRQLTADRVYEVITEVDKAVIETSMPASLWCMPFAASIAHHTASYSCRVASVIDIGVSGEILLCDVLDYRLTSIRERSLREAWEEAESHELSRRVANPMLREPCLNCNTREICLGGCYARSLKAWGTFDGPDPLCPLASRTLPETRRAAV